ncbi:MAG: glycerate kinase [Burkholderiaceae bacterium]|jgi:glycerate kinase
MRVVIAPDSFKESLSARDVAQAIADGVLQVFPQASIVSVPMADGGEGSLDAVLSATGGELRTATVLNALAEPCQADWGWLPGNTAFIEMATAAGLAQTPKSRRNPRAATSYGVGQLIGQALDAGARKIVLGLGGSATNDGGAGLLQALGARYYDAQGTELGFGAEPLLRLHRIALDALDTRLADVEFELAVDVDNPLCGDRGASAIFGPQKGASNDDVALLDAALARFADVCAQQSGRDHREMPGMGAAGGLGFAVKTFFKAQFRPGVQLIAELSNLPQAIATASLVFTGEGRMDSQTLLGKTPAGVAAYAKRQGIPVIALVGSLGPGYEKLYESGITAAFSLAPGPVTLDDALANAAQYLRQRAVDSTRLWASAMRRA